MDLANVQYIVDGKGKNTAVIVPIEVWDEIISESETSYLLKSEAMRKRLLEAKNRDEGIPFEEACQKLGI